MRPDELLAASSEALMCIRLQQYHAIRELHQEQQRIRCSRPQVKVQHTVLLQQFVVVPESRPIESFGYFATPPDEFDQYGKVVLFGRVERLEATE